MQMVIYLCTEAGRMAQNQMDREEQHSSWRKRSINEGFYHQDNATGGVYGSLGETESFILRPYSTDSVIKLCDTRLFCLVNSNQTVARCHISVSHS
jgi:hypothetical protein